MNICKGDIVLVTHWGLGRVLKGDHCVVESSRWNWVLVNFGRMKPSVWCEPKYLRVVRRCQK